MLRGASRTHILTLAHQSFTQARLILQKIHPSRSFVEMAPDHSASARQTFLSQKKFGICTHEKFNASKQREIEYCLIFCGVILKTLLILLQW